MKVEEKNKSDLKQDQSNSHQSKKDVDVVVEKDKIHDEKNKEVEGLESKNEEGLNDKKVKDGKINWVLLKSLGTSFTKNDISEDVLMETVREL